MKPLVWAISALSLSLLCVAAAIVWQGRIQSHYANGSLVVIDRFTNKVRSCFVTMPVRDATGKDDRLLDCGTPDRMIWKIGGQEESSD
jgi:hypothetical protein